MPVINWAIGRIARRKAYARKLWRIWWIHVSQNGDISDNAPGERDRCRSPIDDRLSTIRCERTMSIALPIDTCLTARVPFQQLLITVACRLINSPSNVITRGSNARARACAHIHTDSDAEIQYTSCPRTLHRRRIFSLRTQRPISISYFN